MVEPAGGQVTKLQEGSGIIPSLSIVEENIIDELSYNAQAVRMVRQVKSAKTNGGEEKFQCRKGEVPRVDAVQRSPEGRQGCAEGFNGSKGTFWVGGLQVPSCQ